MLKGCANGICAGGCVAGTDIDLFGSAGARAVMVNAVGYVTGNTVVFFAGFAGSFGRIVVHGSLSFQSKKLERRIRLSVSYCLPDFIVLCKRIKFFFIFRHWRNISLAQSANIIWAKPKYHILPLAKYITATLKTLL